MTTYDILLDFQENKGGRFFIEKDSSRIAELDFEIDDNIINAYHTGVRHQFEGQGIAALLVDKLAEFAAEKTYKIIPTCSYIFAKFRHAPDKYNPVWYRHSEEPTGESCGLKRKKS